MTREQILEIAKPILFSPPMVRAIADDHKTATRRVIKPQPVITDGMWQWKDCQWMDKGLGFPVTGIEDYSPHQPGDFLWVRETWCQCATIDSSLSDTALYAYKADYLEQDTPWKWRPSIHMPKAAARLFLRVTDVCAERLQDITGDECAAEGIALYFGPIGERDNYYRGAYARLWDSLYPKADLPVYGWHANPWVRVIKFERIVPS